ncbi:GIY-YIG nuclease family protein [Ulvibacter antarcticus]|uniref:Putative endonuclease n=1 Tax=Ulvibacter antarcticus TaxID=442714 RepID=A0A3L9YDV9_9FLAO|nr:GIY-YIG nuclease family protein [Ulvibacter antarcticus]RMA58886.1 putative endonuclease [Ulvibacter antarcticus]
MKTYYVYILKCSDNRYYTGFTSNLSKRFEEHQTGKYKGSYTCNRRPLILSFYTEFTNPSIAIETEKQIKNWSKAKKEALINGAYDELVNLAKKNFK